jgi:hypothetical protein
MEVLMKRALSAFRLLLCLCLLGLGVTPVAAASVQIVQQSVKKGASTKAPKTKKASTNKTKRTKPKNTAKKSKAACKTCTRDGDGRIARSGTQKAAFMKLTGYPHGRPGYVVDHIIPLACGGPDVKENMQWQTVAAAKAKDKSERQGCTR